MFDTVKASYQIMLDIEQFQQLQDKYNVIISEYLNSETGEITFTAQIRGQEIHFIKYFSKSATLLFKVSIPRYTLGSNYKTMRYRDFEMFYFQLLNDFKQLLNINLDVSQIKVIELDVCHNFDIGDTGYNMVEWLTFLSKQEIPRKPTKTVYYYAGEIT